MLGGILEVPVFVVVDGIVPIYVFEDFYRAGNLRGLLDTVVHVGEGLLGEQAGIGGIDSVLSQKVVIEADGFIPLPFPARFFAPEGIELVHAEAEGRQGDVESPGVGVVVGAGVEREVELLGEVEGVGNIGRGGVGQVVVQGA